MDMTAVQRESVEILTRTMADVVAVREQMNEARWVAPCERMGASLQMLLDALAARVVELGGLSAEAAQTVLPSPRMGVQADTRQATSADGLYAVLVRYTRIHADVTRSFGDARSASLLAQVRRSLVLLQWQARLLAHADDSQGWD